MKLTKIFGVPLLIIGLFSSVSNADSLGNGWVVFSRSNQVGFVGSAFYPDHPVGLKSNGCQEIQMRSAPEGTLTMEKSFNNIPLTNEFVIWYEPTVLNPAQSNTSLDMTIEVSSDNVTFYPMQTIGMSRALLWQWCPHFFQKPTQVGNQLRKVRITIRAYYDGGWGSDTIVSHLRLDEFWTSEWSYPQTAIDRFENLTGITPTGEIAERYSLDQNYPNPFNPVTNIKFSIPEREFVTLSIFDALGKEIEILVSEEMNTGTYVRDWNAGKYASGIYFCRIKSGEFTDTKRMILVK